MFHDITLKKKDITDEMFKLCAVQDKLFLFHTLRHQKSSDILIF